MTKDVENESCSLLEPSSAEWCDTVSETYGGRQYTVNECLEEIGFGKFHILLTIVLGFAWVADAIIITSLAVLGPALQCYWNLSPEQTALISTCTFIGMFFGGWFWGWFCDTLGRKLTLTVSASLIVSALLLSSFAFNYNIFLVTMVFQGFSIVGAGQSMTLLFELLPADKRGLGLALLGVFFVVGNVISALVAYVVMDSHGWRSFVRLTCVPIVILLLFLWWLPESPRYLLGSGKRDEATRVLKKIANENGVDLPKGRLEITPCFQKLQRGRVVDLLAKDQRRTTLILWLLCLLFSGSVGYFVITAFYFGTTLLLNNQPSSCGNDPKGPAMKHLIIKRTDIPYSIININIINNNNNNITTSNSSSFNHISGLFPSRHQYCHHLQKDDYLGFLFTSFGEIPGVLLCFGLADRLGRRNALSVLFGVSMLSMSLLHICLRQYFLVVTLFILRAFVTAVVQTVYLYTPEVYPTNIRAIGFGTASSMARIGAIITPFVSQILLETYPHSAIFIYSALMVICVIASLLLPIETKGMNLKEFESQGDG